VGGVLGGLFNALLAPQIFKSMTEYPLAIVLACMLRPRLAALELKTRMAWLELGLPLSFGLLMVLLVLVAQASGGQVATTGAMVVISSVATLICYGFANRPLAFGLGVGMIMLTGVLYTGGQYPVLHRERSFFGGIQVKIDATGQYRVFYHGTTLHGAQSTDPNRRREPLTYFHAAGPLGQVFTAFGQKPRHEQVAIIGLGTGSMACYALPGQKWVFYEIDPAVERIARDPRYFTFLEDSPAPVEVILGDARLTLAQAPDGRYDLIVFDAFSSDAVPLHLISQEALRLYLNKLADGGLLMFNISNRYLNLQPVLANLAQDAGLECRVQDYWVNEAEQNLFYLRSMWVVMARTTADLGILAQDPRWTSLTPDPKVGLWSDDFSNILKVFIWPSIKIPWGGK
jgi:hypothetical protein